MKPINEVIAEKGGETVLQVSMRSLQPSEADSPRHVLLDRILVESACLPIGDSWYSLTPDDAQDYARMGFSFDLAHTGCRVADDDLAAELADLFFSQFAEGRETFANVSDNPWRSKSCASSPTTDWTFDLSLITIDSERVELLCFTAED